MLTSRRQRPLTREHGTLRDARLLVIATEGELTEKIYFEQFGDSRVKVRIIPSVNGRSAPQHVLQNLVEYAQTYEIGHGDELWLLVDRDRWKPASISKVAAECARKGWHFALSNPSFELWLCLHFDCDLAEGITQKELEAILRIRLGSFSKSAYDAPSLLDKIDQAVERATQLDVRPMARWPNKIGSRVYRLIKSLRA